MAYRPLSSAKGGAFVVFGGSPVLTRNTTQRLGIRIAPHDARAAATTWAIAAPGQIGLARDLLAHSDLRTTLKHDNRAKGIGGPLGHIAKPCRDCSESNAGAIDRCQAEGDQR